MLHLCSVASSSFPFRRQWKPTSLQSFTRPYRICLGIPCGPHRQLFSTFTPALQPHPSPCWSPTRTDTSRPLLAALSTLELHVALSFIPSSLYSTVTLLVKSSSPLYWKLQPCLGHSVLFLFSFLFLHSTHHLTYYAFLLTVYYLSPTLTS